MAITYFLFSAETIHVGRAIPKANDFWPSGSPVSSQLLRAFSSVSLSDYKRSLNSLVMYNSYTFIAFVISMNLASPLVLSASSSSVASLSGWNCMAILRYIFLTAFGSMSCNIEISKVMMQLGAINVHNIVRP